MNIELTDEERTLLFNALSVHSNWIQTGNVVLNAGDAACRLAAMTEEERRRADFEIKPLSMSQMELLVKMDRLSMRLLKVA